MHAAVFVFLRNDWTRGGSRGGRADWDCGTHIVPATIEMIHDWIIFETAIKYLLMIGGKGIPDSTAIK